MASCLVKHSQNALTVLDYLLESDPGVPVLLMKSLEKCLVYAKGCYQDAPDQAKDCLAQVLETMHWLSLYGTTTAQLAFALFKKQLVSVILPLVIQGGPR